MWFVRVLADASWLIYVLPLEMFECVNKCGKAQPGGHHWHQGPAAWKMTSASDRFTSTRTSSELFWENYQQKFKIGSHLPENRFLLLIYDAFSLLMQRSVETSEQVRVECLWAYDHRSKNWFSYTIAGWVLSLVATSIFWRRDSGCRWFSDGSMPLWHVSNERCHRTKRARIEFLLNKLHLIFLDWNWARCESKHPRTTSLYRCLSSISQCFRRCSYDKYHHDFSSFDDIRFGFYLTIAERMPSCIQVCRRES